MSIGFALTKRDLDRLDGVHPTLRRVVIRAAELSPVPFMVVEGVRPRENCMVNYGKGRTIPECVVKGVPAKYAQPGTGKVTWLNDPFNSMHVKQADGYGHAVDLLPKPYDWKDPKLFNDLNEIMKKAAKELGIHLRWGADWNQNGKAREKGETDSPHWEIGR